MNRSRLIATSFALALPTAALAQPGATTPEDASAVPDGATAPAPASAPAVNAAPNPAGPDIDLASLGLDPNAAAFDDKLNIYGFADLTYGTFRTGKPLTFVPSTRAFSAGAVDLYFAKNQTEHWRSLVEVRLMYAPNGSTDPSTGEITTTAVNDPSNLSLPTTWGGISIERAYVEYDVSTYLTIRAGHFLTPYGIWNTDHGSPTIIPPSRPYVISEGFFPEHQTGLDLLGRVAVGDYHVGYHATVTNGRSPTESVTDPDKQLAFGGRLELEAPFAGTLKLGVSAYKGRFTATATTPGTIPSSYDEVSYAADALWDHAGWHVQTEIVGNEHHYLDGARARTASGFANDGRQWGGYMLAGYRFDRVWNAMPYATFSYIDPSDKAYWDHVSGFAIGLNFRPTANIVLKAEYTFAASKGSDTSLFGSRNTLDLFNAQVAWLF